MKLRTVELAAIPRVQPIVIEIHILLHLPTCVHVCVCVDTEKQHQGKQHFDNHEIPSLSTEVFTLGQDGAWEVIPINASYSPIAQFQVIPLFVVWSWDHVW